MDLLPEGALNQIELHDGIQVSEALAWIRALDLDPTVRVSGAWLHILKQARSFPRI